MIEFSVFFQLSSAHQNLNQCVAMWNNFSEKFNAIDKWIDATAKQVEKESEGENKTPDDLARCKVKIIDFFLPLIRVYKNV